MAPISGKYIIFTHFSCYIILVGAKIKILYVVLLGLLSILYTVIAVQVTVLHAMIFN